jgi:hypothetical protein
MVHGWLFVHSGICIQPISSAMLFFFFFFLGWKISTFVLKGKRGKKKKKKSSVKCAFLQLFENQINLECI